MGKLSRRGRPLPGWRRGAEQSFTCPPYQRRQRGEGAGRRAAAPVGSLPPAPAWSWVVTIPQPPVQRGAARCRKDPRAPLRKLRGSGSQGRVLHAAAPGTSQTPGRRSPRDRKPLRRPERPPLPPGLFQTRAGCASSSISLGLSGLPCPGVSPFAPAGPFAGSSEISLYTAINASLPPPSPAAGTGGELSRHSGRIGTPAPRPCSWARGAGERLPTVVCRHRGGENGAPKLRARRSRALAAPISHAFSAI